MKKEQEEAQKEKALLDDLRTEMYYQEWEARERERDAAEQAKRVRERQVLRMAEKEDHEMKARRVAEEQRMEKEFKETMMRKFAEDERLEQMNNQKRRMKELEHKREVERMWKERLAVYQAERQKEYDEEKKRHEDNSWKDQIIQEEKERLIREHLPYIDGFMPKGIVQKPQDTRLFAYSQQAKY